MQDILNLLKYNINTYITLQCLGILSSHIWHFFVFQVLFKLQINGICDFIELNEVLANLSMTQDDFLCMCILAGCDYLQNIRGIGINKARMLVLKEADVMEALPKLKNFKEGYIHQFFEAKSVFLHQTVIDPNTMETIPLTNWEDTATMALHQVLCGKYPFVC